MMHMVFFKEHRPIQVIHNNATRVDFFNLHVCMCHDIIKHSFNKNITELFVFHTQHGHN